MLASCWVARKIFLSAARASSSARTLDSRPTTKGVIMCGKMTTSRIGIMGSFLLSNFSLAWLTGSPKSCVLPDSNCRFPARSRRANFTAGRLGLTNLTGVQGLRLPRFFHHGERNIAFLHHVLGYFELFHLLLAGQMVHKIEHQLFQDHAQTARSHFAGLRLASDRTQSLVTELQAHILKFEEALILLHDGILRTGQNVDQRGLVQLFEHTHYRHTTDEFRDESELNQVMWLHVGHKFRLLLLARRRRCLSFLFASLESESFPAGAASDDLVESYESAAADEQNVRRVYGSEFLVRMLSSALGRYVGYGAFQDLQQSLLHAFPRNVAGDRGILVLAANLIDFVNVDDASLRAANVAFGGLQQLKDDIFDVLANVARFRQGCRVHDRERNIQHLGECLGQQSFTRPGGTDQKNVGLGQFNTIPCALAVHVNVLVVVVKSDGQFLLGLLLADDVFIDEGLYLLRLGKRILRLGGWVSGSVIFQNGIADRDTLITYIGARIIAGR